MYRITTGRDLESRWLQVARIDNGHVVAIQPFMLEENHLTKSTIPYFSGIVMEKDMERLIDFLSGGKKYQNTLIEDYKETVVSAIKKAIEEIK